MKNKNILIGLGVLVVLLAAYAFTRPKQDTTTEVSSTQNSTTAQAEYYNIPELGIRIPNSPALDGLTYQVQDLEKTEAGLKIANFTSSKIVEKAREVHDELGSRDCANQDVGSAARLASFPSEPGPGLPNEPVDFGDFIITFAGPQGACTDNAQTWAVAQSFITGLEKAFSSVEQIDGKKGKPLELGTIEGSFSYPGEGIPATMQACAESVATKKIHCQGGSEDKKFTYGKGYSMQLPVGTYTVYATTAANPRDPKEKRAYYSQFVTCGLEAECKDHTPITVIVKKDQTTAKVDPQDWYK